MQQQVDILGKVFNNPNQVDGNAAGDGANLALSMLTKANEAGGETALS